MAGRFARLRDQRGPRHTGHRQRARRRRRIALGPGLPRRRGRPEPPRARERGRLLPPHAPRPADVRAARAGAASRERRRRAHDLLEGRLEARVAYSSTTQPNDVYLYDLDARELTRLTTSPRAVDSAALAEPELHRFESFDGESIPVFLFRPAGEGPFPVVVTVHGGPEAQWRPSFSPGFAPLTQHLLSRGYAVAAPNVRGSAGYGKRFEHLDDVRLRLDSVRDLGS